MSTQNFEPPLNLPLYGASFGQAVNRFFKKYADFTGRASRSEFWWTQLFIALVYLIPVLVAAIGADQNGFNFLGAVLLFLISLIFIVPVLALYWRRLHDANLPGPLYFITFIAGIGSTVLLVLTILPSSPEGARFDRRF